MKNFLLGLLIIVGLSVNEVQAYDYLELVKIDGSKKTVSTEGLDIEVTPHRFILSNDQGENISISFSNLRSMVFTNVEIQDNGDVWNDEEPDSDDGEKPGNNPSLLDKTIVNDAPVEVFAIDGTYLGRYASIAEASHNLSSGIYVMRDENKNSIKIKIGK